MEGENRLPQFRAVLRNKLRELYGSDPSLVASRIAMLLVAHPGKWLRQMDFRCINVDFDVRPEETNEAFEPAVAIVNRALVECRQTKLTARTVMELEDDHANWCVKLVIEGQLQSHPTVVDYYNLALKRHDQMAVALRHLGQALPV